MNFGIIGAGNIAEQMAYTIMKMPEANMYAIASRSMERALDYKNRFGMQAAYDSYEELVRDENVDVVYIATPHSFHYEQAKMCLKNGKHVLCEKAFTVNAKQAEELIAISEKTGLFLGEAMWTRFMPLIDKLEDILNRKKIGEVASMTANLSLPMLQKERLIKRELAGGALLDVGIYPLTMASIVMGDDIDYIKASGILTEEGVDKIGQYTLVYKNGTLADLNSGMCAFGDSCAVIYGTEGRIVVAGVNCPECIEVYDGGNHLIERWDKEVQISGYEYEVKACVEDIKAGRTESKRMPHSTTLKMMQVMDEIRRQMKVIYPCE